MYIATFTNLDGHDVINKVEEDVNRKTLKANEVRLSKEVFDVLKDAQYKHQILSKSKEVTSLESLSVYKEPDREQPEEKRFLASYTIRQGKKFLTGLTVRSTVERFTLDKYVPISEEIYNKLKEKEKDLAFTNTYISTTVTYLDNEKEIKTEDAEEAELNEEEIIQKLRMQNIIKAKEMLLTRLDTTSFIGFASLMVLNNKLMDRGFIITDENREDKYLEIVNKDDVELLDLLSKYLETYDNVQAHIHHYGLYVELVENINSCDSEEEILQYMEEYESKFI